MATALLDKANALTAANKINPTLGTFDESKGVAGRVNQIASQDGPLMQLAATGAKQQANKLGMRNSSLAIGAGQKAVLEAATPIANADAGLYQQQQLTNQNASNTASTANSTNAITAGMRGLELGEQSRQFDTNAAINNQQFEASIGQQTKLAEMDRASKMELANVEASFKNDIQNSANISNAWGSMMERIGQVQNNPELDAAAKTTLINNNIGAFKSFAAFWNKSSQIDVSDLLNISAAAAPSAGTGDGGFGQIPGDGGGYNPGGA